MPQQPTATFEAGQEVWFFGPQRIHRATVASVHGPVIQIKKHDGQKIVTEATKPECLAPRNGDDWPRVPIYLQQKCAQNELAKREQVYPRLIEAHKLTFEKAEAEKAAMKSIIETLDTHRHIETALLRWQRGEITEGNAVRAIAKLFEIGEAGR